MANLFAFARLEYLGGGAQRVPLDLGALLRATADEWRPQAAANGITLHLDGPAAPCPLRGDARLLGRAVGNLVDNALRHTPPGGSARSAGRPRRGSSASRSPIPGQAPPARDRDTGGAGLGLAIARRIVRAHGGELTVGNGAAGGAAVTIILPASPSAARATDVNGTVPRGA